MNMKQAIVACAMLALLAVPAWADWNVGQPAKWVQMPDENGWDVKADDFYMLGDDFLCTQSGPITGIHFWASNLSDVYTSLTKVHAGIYSNNPSGPYGFSQPDQMLWTQTFDEPWEFTTRYWGSGDQGWYVPGGQYLPNNHENTWQVNLPADGSFHQVAGQTYWLVLTLEDFDAPEVGEWGWKTSENHWNDAAVRSFGLPGSPPSWWGKLNDPITDMPLDLAFVITGVPEPATAVLLAAGGFILLGTRRMWR